MISISGGEAFPVTRGLEEVHAFDWAPDSKSLVFCDPYSLVEEQARGVQERME